MRRSRVGRWLVALLVVAAGHVAWQAHPTGPSGSPEPAALRPGPRVQMARLPLAFEPNVGQAADPVDFVSRGPGYALALTPTAAVVALRAKDRQAVVRLQLAGANPKARPTHGAAQAGVSNYFLGNDPTRWRTNVKHFGRAGYRGVYDGIDVVYYGNQEGRLEHDFHVAPGADPQRIAFAVEGAARTSLTKGGELSVQAGGGELRLRKPVAWQETAGQRVEVPCEYLQREGQVRFALGEYDRRRELVIDPVLVYSTYLGGSSDDTASAVAVDGAGSAYVIGRTQSAAFPLQVPYQGTYGGTADAFVTKLSADGTALVYSTYLGGTGDEWGRSIALDSGGNAYLIGTTSSGDFPTVSPLQASLNGTSDAFIAKLDSGGSALTFSTYLGGAAAEQGNGITTNAAGNVFVTGYTGSTDFPKVAPYQSVKGAGDDIFVAKLSPAGDALVYGTFLGGNQADYGFAIAVDGSDNMYVAGGTSSSNYPTANALDTVLGGTSDACVAKLSSDGASLIYSTYLGGSGSDQATALALDAGGAVYLAGYTSSTNWPTANPVQATNAGSDDAFVAQLNAAGSMLVFSTYHGGSNADAAYGIAVDEAGVATVVGRTASANLPTVNALQATHGGSTDLFVCRYTPLGSSLAFATFLGGSGQDSVSYTRLGLKPGGQAVVAGNTLSTNFPTAQPFQGSYAGGSTYGDAFVAELDDASATTYTVTTTANAGAGSLREAIAYCNAHPGADTITFDISGGGVKTISPTAALPALTEQVTIDGTTQPGTAVNTASTGTNATPKIVLNGTAVSTNPGLLVSASNCTIRGLVIQNWMSGGVQVTGSSNLVAGCFIGCDSSGLNPSANGTGVLVTGGTGNQIGETTLAGRNLISGNTSHGVRVSGGSGTLVRNNLCGTTATGSAALPNGQYGVSVENVAGNTIGGTTTAARNVLSGNTESGVRLLGTGATGNSIQGNYLGVGADGVTDVGNTQRGVILTGGAGSNTIGGAVTGAGNVISGNGAAGVQFEAGGNNNFVQGNVIGLAADGVTVVANNYTGVSVLDSGSNTIGGTSAPERNVIAGNNPWGVVISGASAASNTLSGNYLGVAADGTTAAPNVVAGVWLSGGATGNVIGGTTAGAGNLVSGNSGPGVGLDGAGTGNQIVGNRIGVNAAGTAAVANSGAGVSVSNTGGTTIGGTTVGHRNVISGNTTDGVRITGASSTGNVVAANYIGVNAAGTAALANGNYGVVCYSGASSNVIGGSAATTGTPPGNVISGNTMVGVRIETGNSNNNRVLGNLIGLDATGTVALSNNWGVWIGQETTGNQIGGASAAERNVISGNAYGVILGTSTGNTANLVKGNLIGPNLAGSSGAGNTVAGVSIDGASNSVVGGVAAGEANVIAFNAKGLILATTYGTGSGNTFRGNAIHSNTGLGIDLNNDGVTANDPGDPDTGPNGLLNYPTLTAAYVDGATTVEGTLDTATAAYPVTIDFYVSDAPDSSGNGEGQTWQGSVTLATSAEATFVATGLPATTVGQYVTATATDTNGNTSEFSGARPLTTGPLVVTTVTGTALGSLPYAINHANAQAGADTITFNIPGGGAQTISPTTALPAITEQVTIDGYSQPGAAVNTATTGTNATPLIALDGTAVSASPGLVVNAANCLIRGLVIRSFLSGGVVLNGNANTVAGCFLGCNPTGTAAAGNGVGVQVTGGTGNLLGDETLAGRNLIAGNTSHGVRLAGGTGTLVRNNLIGITAAGTAVLANGGSGVSVEGAGGTSVGGATAAAGNVISGNTQDGVRITGVGSAGSKVSGNHLGLDPTGETSLPNGRDGVQIDAVPATSGGIEVVNNLISGNGRHGVAVLNGTALATLDDNVIGANLGLTAARGNTGHGVLIQAATDTSVGSDGGGNHLVGNGQAGLQIEGATTTGTAVLGNCIGATEGGLALPNALAGIRVQDAADALIGDVSTGGLAAGEGLNASALSAAGNLISGNTGPGVLITGSTATGVELRCNTIGLNAAGTGLLSNGGPGVQVDNGATGITIGGPTGLNGNLIAGNATANVAIVGPATAEVAVLGNLIGLLGSGSAAPTGAPTATGVVVTGGASDVQIGLENLFYNVISGHPGSPGIQVDGATNTLIEGNLIGTSQDGLAAVPNGSHGIVVSGTATGTVIGGSDPSQGNLVSGNTGDGLNLGAAVTGTQVLNNVVGVNETGAAALPNGVAGLRVAGSSTIIGAPGAGNVLSGNTQSGLVITGASNVVSNNFIGSGAGGTTAIPNGQHGVSLLGGATGNTIGGTADTACNVISGNAQHGVRVSDSGTSNNLIRWNWIGTRAAGAGALPNGGTGVQVEGGAANTTVSNNLISGNTGRGVVVTGSATQGTVLQANTIGLHGTDGTALPNAGGGVLVSGGALSTLIGGVGTDLGNLIANHTGAGVVVQDAGTRAAIRDNEIIQNTALAIDLAVPGDPPGGVTANDAGDADTGPNGLLNFPVIEGAQVTSGGDLTVTGWARPGAEVEVYEATGGPFGPGVRRIATLTEGSPSDTDPGTGTYTSPVNGQNQGTDTTSRFRFVIPASGLVVGQSVTATATLGGVTSEFGANTAVFTTGAQLAFTGQPTTAVAGVTMGPAVTVAARDGSGNTVTTATGSVTLVLTGPTGPADASASTLLGTTTAPLVNGVATFSDLKIEQAGIGYQLTASLPDYAGASSTAFDITPAAPAALEFAAMPTTGVSGQPLAPAVEVLLRDAFGNLAGQATDQVTVALTGGPAGAVLGGGTTVAAVSGKATFSDLTVDLAGSDYALTAAAGGLTGATSATFTVTSDGVDSARSSLTTDQTVVTADGVATATLTVVVRDSAGNPVPNAAVAFDSGEAAAAAAGVTITAPPGQVSDANGQATATATSTRAATVVFRATAGGVLLEQTVTVTFQPGPASGAQSSLAADQTTATADGADVVTLTVTVRDAQGNPVPNVPAADLQVTTPAPDVTITQPTTATDAAGQTTATATCTRAQTVTFTATVGTITVTTTATVQYQPGAADPAQSGLAADPATATADGADVVTLTVTVRDAQGNPVPNVPAADLQVTTPAPDVTITQPTTATDAAGQTTARATCTRAQVVVFTATVGGAALAQTATVQFEPGAADPAQSDLAADQTALVADGVAQVTFTVTVRDAQGNPVAGVAKDRLAVTTGGASVTIAAPAADTDAAGQTTATAHSTKAQQATFTATLDGTPLGSPVAVQFEPGPVDVVESTLVADRTTARADGVEAIALTLTLRDQYRNAIPGVPAADVALTGTSSLGGDGLELVGASGPTDAAGQVALAARARRPQAATLTVTVGPAAWSVDVTFTPRAISAEQSTVVVQPAVIAADGEEVAELRVVLRDAGGAPVEGSPVAERSVSHDGPAGLAVVDLGAASDPTGACVVQVTAADPGAYQITVQVGGVALAPATLTAMPYSDLNLRAGLNFMGLPCTPDPASLLALLTRPGVEVVGWDAVTQQYLPVAPSGLAEADLAAALQPGRGFWLRSATSFTWRLRGVPLPPEPVRLPLAAGWNAAANPFGADLPWPLDRVRVEVNGTDVGSLANQALWASTVLPYGWVYDPAALRGYQLVFDPTWPGFGNSLGGVPQQAGLWLRARAANVTLVVPPPAALSRARVSRAVGPRDWCCRLTATLNGAADTPLVAGVSGSLTRALPVADPPPADEPPLVDLAIVGSDGGRLAGLVHAATGQSYQWDLVATTRAAGEVVITWPGLLRDLPRGVLAELADLETGATTLLNTRAAWRWAAPAGETRRLRLTARYGNLQRSAITGLLLQPNRAGGAALTLSLSGPATIEVRVRGLGGRLVKQVAEAAAAAGTVTVTWDGTDQAGRPVPAGSYVVEATAVSANGALSRAVRTVTVD